MNRAHLLAPALLAMAACGVHDRSEHRWIGTLTAMKPAPQCPSIKAVLILRESVVTFAPDEGTWVLTGKATSNTLTATRSRPTPDHKLYKTDLQAEWTDATVRGTYTTPECTYRVDLASY